ncbi:uncharacterized protein LOC119610151 [Lucilia sericata]|uniref:uncharacterized protein LOC119610151 n=1 Tax=Lucilia sericata TaxID=13632 RepID=UPI0018A864F8|nr:uncharacterized protein LOC119610151 [Lucilia sericata]
MSYLLTEIALEMLGYKFYDIYGMQDEINNFQKQTNTERTSDSNGTETNLAQLLGVNMEGDRNRKSNAANNKELFEEVNANLPDSLNKLMDCEYNKVRQQVLHNKPVVMDNQNAQAIIQNFIETEHEKLRFEHQSLRNFRKIVEQNLLQVNPATFEKYCQTFKPARKQLKRLDGNKK